MREVASSRSRIVFSSAILFSTIFLFSFLVFAMVGPITSTYADDMNVNVSVEPTLSMSLSTNEINLDIDASNFGNVVESDPLTVNVSTNNRTGYNLILNGSNVQAPSEARTLADISTMQDITKDTCKNTPLFSVSNTTYELTDTRDNNIYSIRKLDDGNCWMVENLKLKGGTTITPEDSDVTENFTLPESSTTNMTYDNKNIPLMNDGLDNDGDGVTDDTYDSYGAYYNWYAATANSGTFGSPGNAPSSICAKGWKLPTNDNYNILLGNDSNYVNSSVIGVFGVYLFVGYYNANHIYDTVDGHDYYNIAYSGKGEKSFYSTSDQQKINHYVYISNGFVHYSNDWDDKIMSARCVVTASEPNNEPIQYSDLKPTSSQNTTTIRSIPTQISRNTWQSSSDYNNQYGFTHDNTNFLAPDYFIPVYTDTQPTTIKNTESASKTSNTNITFATKIDSNQLAGNYSNDFTISAVTNYSISVATIFNIHKMQQMTPEICSNTTTPSLFATNIDTDGSHIGNNNYVPQATLIDTRGDGRGHEQTYVVRKLADGNCWMSQNLNLFLTAGNELTSDTTDLNSKNSWDPGTTTREDDLELDGFQNIPEGVVSDSSTSYSRGNYYCSGGYGNNTSRQVCNYVDTNDESNHVGILYNWYAASTGFYSESVEYAPDSICPRGWQLPDASSERRNNSGNMFSYKHLIKDVYRADDSTEGSRIIKSFPLSFVASGYYSGGSIWGNQERGAYWLSGKNDTNYFNFYPSSVLPYNMASKYYGSSIRCVAR